MTKNNDLQITDILYNTMFSLIFRKQGCKILKNNINHKIRIMACTGDWNSNKWVIFMKKVFISLAMRRFRLKKEVKPENRLRRCGDEVQTYWNKKPKDNVEDRGLLETTEFGTGQQLAQVPEA
jgi:hypothetical protein